MKLIPAKHKQDIRFIIVDDHNYDRLKKFNWYHNGLGSVSRQFWSNKMERVRIANEILQVTGTVDHIDRDGFNNLESNLRCCTMSQNQGNVTKQKNTSSKYKGVTWHKAHKKWVVGLMKKNKRHHLGYFLDEVQAARAYNKAAAEYFVEFANLNKDEQGNVL